MNRYYRESLVHGVLVFVDSLILWLGMYLLGLVFLDPMDAPLLLFSVGAFLFGIGGFVLVIEIRAFRRREYEEIGPITQFLAHWEANCAATGEFRLTRFQFGLRALLLLVWFTSLALSLFSCYWMKIKQKREKMAAAAIVNIVKLGGAVETTQSSSGKRMTAVRLSNSGVTNAELEHLCDLSDFQSLNLSNTRVTDAGLKHLAALYSLQILDLSGPFQK